VTVDDYFFVFPAEDGYDEQCILGFLDGTNQDYWLLGDVFLRGYYSIHDNSDRANARIGFAPHVKSNKKNVERTSDLPEKDIVEVLPECTRLYGIFGR
jgi:hypothetical protein